MTQFPEDGSLEELTSPVPAFNAANVVIIQISDELTEPGGKKCLFATFDRSKEGGGEWPGDKFLEKLISDLPKVKISEVSKPEVTNKTYTHRRYHLRKKYNQRPVHRDNRFPTRRSRPPYKRFHYHRSENSHNIDPWLKPPQHLFAPNTIINNYTFPNNDKRNMIPSAASNIQFINDMPNLNLPPTATNGMPCGPLFQPPERFLNQRSVRPDRGFSGPGAGPTQNMDFRAPNNMPGILGEVPGTRSKPGLLGDYPVSKIPFNRNLAPFLDRIPAQSDPEASSATLLPRNQENIGDQNNFISNTKKNTLKKGSYDTGYGRIPRHNFKQYKDSNEIAGPNSHDSYEYPQNIDDSRNNPIRDANETNYSMYHSSANTVNHYDDQYRDNYNHLDCTFPNNKKNINSLKNSRGSYKTNFGRFKKAPRGVNRRAVGNNETRENSYKGSRVSNVSQTSFTNNQTRNLVEEPIYHISDSAVVYNQEDFQNDGYSAAAANSAPRSNLNSVSRTNFRRNIHTKNAQWTKRRGTPNKFTNSKLNRAKYNQGQHKFRNWRTPRK